MRMSERIASWMWLPVAVGFLAVLGLLATQVLVWWFPENVGEAALLPWKAGVFLVVFLSTVGFVSAACAVLAEDLFGPS